VGEGVEVEVETCEEVEVEITEVKVGIVGIKVGVNIKEEVEVYLELDHPHIVRLDQVYENEDEIHIVMDLLSGGTLFDRLHAQKFYQEDQAADTSNQMCSAVAYLHAHKIVHCDLKLENFLYERLDSDHIKLIDFGFAKHVRGRHKLETACGTLQYCAPEVLARSYSEKADMWSLGVLIYMLLTGTTPFPGCADPARVATSIHNIRTGEMKISRRFLGLTKEAQGLVRSLIVVDPVKRLSAVEVLDHPWAAARRRCTDKVDEEDLRKFEVFAQAPCLRRALLWMVARSLKPEDREKLESKFEALDNHHHGVITLQEFQQYLSDKCGSNPSYAKALFQHLDVYRSGEITYSEFLAATLEDSGWIPEDALRTAFEKFDIDGSGKVTKDKVRKVLGDYFDGYSMQDLLRRAEFDHEDPITFEEFQAYLHKPNTYSDADIQRVSTCGRAWSHCQRLLHLQHPVNV